MSEFNRPAENPRPPAGALPVRDMRPLACDPDALSFHIIANDQELLRQVRSAMQQTGLVGISDTAGRLHYLVDGSRGSQYATRRILEMASRRYDEKGSQVEAVRQQLPEAIEQVLDRAGLRHELKGRAFLQRILYLAVLDERKLKPLSKTLYPDVARHFKSRSSQVERDLRYLFSCAASNPIWPEDLGTGNTARISFLCQEVRRELDALQRPDAGLAAGGSGYFEPS